MNKARLEDFADAMFTIKSRHCQHWWKPLRDSVRVKVPNASRPSAFGLRRIVICTLCGKVESR
jgi:hypothetical protein